MGASQIVAGWWGHQPVKTAVAGVLTDHCYEREATIWDAPIFIALFSLMQSNIAQQKPYSQQMAQTAMNIWPDSFSIKPGRSACWSYDQNVIVHRWKKNPCGV